MRNISSQPRLTGSIEHTETCSDSWYGTWKTTVTINYRMEQDYSEDARYPHFNVEEWHVESVDRLQFFPVHQNGRAVDIPDRSLWIPTLEGILDDSEICDACYQDWTETAYEGPRHDYD
jgi:hypothetical protein